MTTTKKKLGPKREVIASPIPKIERMSIEGYGQPTLMHSSLLLGAREPSAFNHTVNVTRYRVIVEPIEEPPEVLAARVEALYAAEDNPHNRAALASYWWRARGTVPGWPDRDMERAAER
jgi:hypothetical protein